MYCLSANVKRYGRSAHGRQRWYCLVCHRTYSWRWKQQKPARRFLWFKLWIVEGYSIREIAELNRVSSSTVRRVIHFWLQQTPQDTRGRSPAKHIIFDGTLLHRRCGVYAAMDAEQHTLVAAAYNVSEGARDLVSFYTQLAASGVIPESATIDGNTAEMKHLRAVWPSILLQRCIVHLQRQGLSWCRRHPKRTDATHLRLLFLQLPEVHTQAERERFLKRVAAWEHRFGPRIQTSANRGWVFSDLMRARSMLLKALPNLFHYLRNPKIARSTNALEGYFSRLKEHYRLHRGLSRKNRETYFQWYFYLIPK